MYIDKEVYTRHIQDEQIRNLAVNVLDKVEIVLNKHEIKSTDFLTPQQAKYINELLLPFDGIQSICTGGYDGAERKIIIIIPEYLDISSVDIPISAIEATGNTQFFSVSHRDYLGSLMGLGLKREKIGDIIINENRCQIIVRNELKDYILFHFNKVGNLSVRVREIQLDDICPAEVEYKYIRGNVASLRLDAVLSLGLKISRSQAQTIISKELVSVNWEVIKKGTHEVVLDDVISIRGRGRLIVDSIGKLTKSGRITIQLKKPI